MLFFAVIPAGDHARTSYKCDIKNPQFANRLYWIQADSVKKIIKKPVTISNLMKEITPILKTSLLARSARQEHVLVLYETPGELIDQSLEFLKVGLLENNEDIMLITGSIPIDSIRSKIVKEWKVEDLNPLEASGMVSLYTFLENGICQMANSTSS
jgi:hypothetical protein